MQLYVGIYHAYRHVRVCVKQNSQFSTEPCDFLARLPVRAAYHYNIIDHPPDAMSSFNYVGRECDHNANVLFSVLCVVSELSHVRGNLLCQWEQDVYILTTQTWLGIEKKTLTVFCKSLVYLKQQLLLHQLLCKLHMHSTFAYFPGYPSCKR